MRKHTFKFEHRKQQVIKILSRGPLTYDGLYKALGADPSNQLRSMLKDGLIFSRKERIGQGSLTRNVYYIEQQPEAATEDVNGFTDALRVLMGYTPIKPIHIEGHVTFYDDIEYHEKHREEILHQAPCIGAIKVGFIQSSSGEMEVYGAA